MAEFYVYRFSGANFTGKMPSSIGLTPVLAGMLQMQEYTAVFLTALSAGDKAQLDDYMLAAGFQFYRQSQGEAVIHPSATICPDERVVAGVPADWQDVGGVVTNPQFFANDLAKVFGRMTIDVNTTGAGAQLRVIQRDAAGADILLGEYTLADNAGAYAMRDLDTVTPPTVGPNRYIVQARLNTASAFSLRFATLLLLEAL